MAPRSLVDICTRICIKNIHEVYSVGDMPYHLARPILLKINKADQLHEVELTSSQIEGETEELWRRLIAKDFPAWEKKNYIPKNPKSWYKVYERYRKEEKAEIAEAEAKLVASFGAIKNEAEAKKSTIVSQQLMPRIPREGRIGGARRAGLGRDVPDHLSWGGGSRTKTNDARGVILKAKREAREMANRRTLSTPTGRLVVPQGQIRKAPEGLVNEYRIKQQAALTSRIRAPRRSNKPKTEAEMADDLIRREREARLLNIKSLSSSRPAQMVSDSEGDEDDYRGGGSSSKGGGFLDDLFDDDEEEEDDAPPPPRNKAPTSQSPSIASSRPSVLAGSRKTGSSTLLSSSRKPNIERRVVQSSTHPARPESAARSVQTSSGQRPAAASLPPPRQQPGPSSPLQRPRPPAGSPPVGMLKRKAETNVFMRKPKMPRQ